jgi:hypothetical protein
MLSMHYANAVKWRVLYLAWMRKGDAAHTVLVTDIPGTQSGTVVGRIYEVRLSPSLLNHKMRPCSWASELSLSLSLHTPRLNCSFCCI